MFDINEKSCYNGKSPRVNIKTIQKNSGKSSVRNFGGRIMSIMSIMIGGKMKPQVIKEKMKSFASQSRTVKLTILFVVTLAIAVITGALYFRNTVYISDNGAVREIKSNETELDDILREAGIKLNDGDKTVFEKKQDDKLYITITRAFDVKVTADGETKTLRLTEGTVESALSEAGVELDEDDIVSPALDEKLFGGIEINASRVEYVEREEQSEIPFETEYKETSNLKIGTQEVLTEGQNGLQTLVYKDKYIDGTLSGTEKISESITKEPVTKVIGKGTSLQVPYAKMKDPEKLELENGLPKEYVKVVSGKSTAYSAKPGSLTASGRYAVVGTVAVNPKVIPYGSELYIVAQDGSRVYGYAIAADTGLCMLDGRTTVDVFTQNYKDACKWGAVYVDIYVLSLGDNKYVSAR